MKKWVSHIMLLAIVTHLLYSSGYLLDYYVNSDFYKINCVNKDRPELHCDGKCILAQKIREAAKDQQTSDQKTMSVPASFEYLIAVFSADFTVFHTESSSHFFWLGTAGQNISQLLIQPPDFIG